MKLSSPLLNHIGPYRLHLSFDRVLRVMDAMGDDMLSDAEKIGVAMRLLVRFPRPCLPAPRAKLWVDIFDRCIKPRRAEPQSGPQAFDFTQDADYIYAAFQQAYGIDLQAERGRMDWREFLALFQGLPDNTIMSEIMSIRLRDVPAPTEYNQDEIRALRKAKRAFALDIKRKPGERFDSDIEGRVTGMFEYYRKKAGEKNG